MNDELERVMETVDLRNGGVDAGDRYTVHVRSET